MTEAVRQLFISWLYTYILTVLTILKYSITLDTVFDWCSNKAEITRKILSENNQSKSVFPTNSVAIIK